MYDQTQFTPLYLIDKNGLYLSEKAYLEMQRISGYAPDKWYTYTQNKLESFWFGAYDQEALDKESETGFRNFTDQSFLENFKKNVEESYQRTKALKEIYFEKFLGKEGEAISNNSSEVAAFLKSIQETVEYVMARYLMTQPQRFYKFEAVLKPSLPDKDLELISTYGRYLTYVSKARKAVLDTALEISESGQSFDEYMAVSSNAKERIEKMSDEIGFLNWSLFGGEILNFENVKKDIEDLLSDPSKLKEEVVKMQELTDNIDKRKQLVSKNQSKEPIKIADIMGHASILRFDLQTCVLALQKYADNFIVAAREKLDLTQDETNSYYFDDLVTLFADNQKVDSQEVEKRQKGFLQVYDKNGTTTYIAEDAHEQIAELLEHRKKEIELAKELKGSVASWPDKRVETVTGECFVMTTTFEGDKIIKDFKEGQILVAPQTHPNVVPVMRQAKAIVTDEGGITCHAAIVSRELGKPCIIGTRLATKIFKNGDQIEVNLKNATVRKI